MLFRGFALLGALAIFPARATLIEYEFASQVHHADASLSITPGDTVTGGFLIDDSAPRILHSETPNGGGIHGLPEGVISTSTYDVSTLLLWVLVGDDLLTAKGDELRIVDAPFRDHRYFDLWHLTLRNDNDEDAGSIYLRSWSLGPLTSSDLQVPIDINEAWPSFGYDRWFEISTELGSLNGSLLSIEPKSVPEPGTLSLLAVGGLGALVARRRSGRRAER